MQNGHPHSYYGVITGREYAKVCEQLSAPKLSLSDGLGVPEFPLEEVKSGSLRLLSIGEGISTFVFDILLDRERNALDLSTVHAFDLFYSQSKPANNDWGANPFFDGLNGSHWNAEFERRDVLINRFPNNYHGGYFQEAPQSLAQVAPFDEIISSHSLAYILGQSEGEGEFAGSADERLLLSVLSLLKKGGYLRIWPYANSNKELEGKPSRYRYLQKGLNGLKARGLIEDHSMTLLEDAPVIWLHEKGLRDFHYVVIRK